MPANAGRIGKTASQVNFDDVLKMYAGFGHMMMPTYFPTQVCGWLTPRDSANSATLRGGNFQPFTCPPASVPASMVASASCPWTPGSFNGLVQCDGSTAILCSLETSPRVRPLWCKGGPQSNGRPAHVVLPADQLAYRFLQLPPSRVCQGLTTETIYP